MNKQVKILIIVAVVLAAGAGFYFWWKNREGGLDLPPGVNEDAWLDTYYFHLNDISNYSGQQLEDYKKKAKKFSRSLGRQTHIDAVWLTNKQYGTNVDGKTWKP